jgi:hypothetical protein
MDGIKINYLAIWKMSKLSCIGSAHQLPAPDRNCLEHHHRDPACVTPGHSCHMYAGGDALHPDAGT